jgi:hypothetical protein
VLPFCKHRLRALRLGIVRAVGERGVETLLPQYDRHEVHRSVYPAPPAAVRAALESVRSGDLPLTRALFAVRLLPSLVTGRRPRTDDRPLVEQLGANGFARLVDTPDEVVFATIGQFWRPDGGRRVAATDARAFRDFAEPGFAKAVMSFELREAGDGRTVLLTETRVQATSASARRTFAAYWLVVGLGSRLIRRELLAAVRRGLPA